MPALNSPTSNTDMLRDIHLPDAVSWWPPAVGWWIVLAIIILAIIFIPKLYRRVTYTPLNKVAKLSFDQITLLYEKNKDTQQLITETSKLLRQVAMSYCPRSEVAHLNGEQWIEKLNSLSNKTVIPDDIQQSLMNAPYQKQPEINPEQLINTVNEWLLSIPRKPGEQTNA